MYLVYKCTVCCRVPRLVFKLRTLSQVDKQFCFIFIYHSEFLGSRNYVVKIKTIIAKRLTVIAEALLLEEQNGFRKGRSCMDCIFSVSQIIEKRREFNIPTYMAFIDFKKALALWTETNYGLLCQVKEFQLT